MVDIGYLCAYGFLYQFCCFAEENGRLYFKTRLIYQFFSFHCVGALQAYNYRNIDIFITLITLQERY